MTKSKYPTQYAVLREWSTSKRRNRLALGPFPSRSKAMVFVRLFSDLYPEQFSIVLFHRVAP